MHCCCSNVPAAHHTASGNLVCAASRSAASLTGEWQCSVAGVVGALCFFWWTRVEGILIKVKAPAGLVDQAQPFVQGYVEPSA